MDHSFLGLIQKAGKLVIGEEPVGAACRGKKASLVLTAADAAPNSIRRASHFAQAGQVLMLPIPLDKEQLGLSVGRPPCAMIAVTDIGFASALAKKIFAANPELDPALLEQLEVKSQKVMQRRKEKRAHEKNVLNGKKVPRLTKVENGKKEKK